MHPAAQAQEAGLSLPSLSSLSTSTSSTLSLLLPSLTTLEEVLPCTSYVDAGCVADLVRGGCNPAMAAAISAAQGLARAAVARVTSPARIAARMKVDVVKFPSTMGMPGPRAIGNGRESSFSSRRQCKALQQYPPLPLTAAAPWRVALLAAFRSGSSHLLWRRRWHNMLCGCSRTGTAWTSPCSAGVRSCSSSTAATTRSFAYWRRCPVAAALAVIDPHQRTGTGAVRISESDFNKLVYCVLSRYHWVLSYGFQMTLGKQAFNVFCAWFNVWFECFASPLNCTCSAYTSAFPLMDQCFGTVWNFFSLRPSSGSFKANPPFIAELTSAMVVHIHELLHDATGPMSFVVIMPGWDDEPSWSEV
jgi:hypothetical protein